MSSNKRTQAWISKMLFLRRCQILEWAHPLIISLEGLFVWPGVALLAQNMTGTWEGMLKVNGPNG
jgi:hypothetical protein